MFAIDYITKDSSFTSYNQSASEYNFESRRKQKGLGAKETPLESPSRMFNRGPLPGRTARTRRKSRQAQKKDTQSTRHLQKQATSKAEYTNTQQDLTDKVFLDMQVQSRVVFAQKQPQVDP